MQFLIKQPYLGVSFQLLSGDGNDLIHGTMNQPAVPIVNEEALTVNKQPVILTN